MSAVKNWIEEHISELTDEDLFEMGLDRETIDEFRGIDREWDDEEKAERDATLFRPDVTNIQRVLMDILSRNGIHYVETISADISEVCGGDAETVDISDVEKLRLYVWTSYYRNIEFPVIDQYRSVIRESLDNGTLNVEDAKDIIWSCRKIHDVLPLRRRMNYLSIIA